MAAHPGALPSVPIVSEPAGENCQLVDRRGLPAAARLSAHARCEPTTIVVLFFALSPQEIFDMGRCAPGIPAVLLLALVVAPAWSATPVPLDAQKLEEIWNRAHLESNTAALDALWADDVTIVVPGMKPLGKAQALKVWRTIPVKFTQYDSAILSTRVEGTVAIVTGRISRARTFGDRAARDAWYFTKAYRLSDSNWRVIAFHASEAAE
jgi:ketosteroid isomerase-like protein